MKRAVTIIALMVLAVPVAGQNRAPAIESITAAALKADLYFLASDDLQGRLTNTLANRIAADWVASRFEHMGLKPAGTESYFQPYELMVERLGPVDQQHAGFLTFGTQFYPQRFSATASASGSVVFAGFGITSPERGYDDLKNDVRGKIVLVLDHEPGERDPASPFDGLVTSEASAAWRKAIYAQDHGAVGILYVTDVHNHPAANTSFEETARAYWPAAPPRIENFTLATWIDRVRVPALQISPQAAEALVSGSGRTLAQLAQASETAHGITPVPLNATMQMSAAVTRVPVPDRNVLGLIEGSDPRLKDELVIVCAHIDHNGTDGTVVYNGADDNGSGAVALVEIAHAMAGTRPRRSVLFAAWNSEERGLLGAWEYTEAPTRPLEKIAAVLNMDMLGRNEEVPAEGGARFRGLQPQTAESNRSAVNVIGSSRSADLKQEVERANHGIDLDLRYRYDNNISQLMRRSDHWPFLNRGVPAIWFHTGLHPDYHTPNDRPERINYAKMEKIARLVYQTAWDLANESSRPKLAGRAQHEM